MNANCSDDEPLMSGQHAADSQLMSAVGERGANARTDRLDLVLAAFTHAPAAIAAVDYEGIVLACNDKFSLLCGRSEDELAGTPFSVLLHSDEAAGATIAFRRFMRGRDNEYEASRRYVRPNGSEVLVREIVRADRSLTPARAIVVVEDVSADSRLLAAITRREERFRAMIENASDLITVASPEGGVLYQSPAVTRLLGWTAEELAEQPAFELMHPDDRERCGRALEKLLEDGETVTMTYRVLHKDGHWLQVEATGSNLVDEPSIGGIVINSRDVTQSHRDQERLREAEEQLRHAQRLEAVGRLASGIAHDFNNLLMGVMGYSGLASGANAAGDVEQVDQHIERVQAAANRAKSLTQQLLAFGRKQLLREEIVDVGAAIVESAELLRRVIGADIEMVVDVDPAVGAVRVDPAQFEQLLMNLAINARDAMPDGGTLTIGAVRREIEGGERLARGRHLAITVSDTGTGMDQETLERLFEPFFTTKPRGKGSGLGLASAHGFISQSGGEIRVSSALGVGSRFEILLPHVAVPDLSAQLPDTDTAAAVDPHAATIILVEDDEIVRKVVLRMLSKNGHTVHAFASPDEALVAVERTSCDALIIDVVMPQTSGVALTRELRRRHNHTRVLLMSGYSDERSDSDVTDEPYVSFIQKPFTSRELAASLDELLRR